MGAVRTGAAALAMAATWSAAAAGSVGVLAVALPPGPGPGLAEAAAELRQAMAARDPSQVLDARRLGDRMRGRPVAASLAELDRAYEGARAVAVGGDYEGSARALRAIVEELEAIPDGEETFRQWTRAVMRLAKSESDLGRGDEVRGVLERLVRAAPDVAVDPALFPPRFAAQVEEARAHLKALPTHRLSVASPAKAARVFVDGRFVGTAPLTVALPAGRYRVSGALGAAVARQAVDLGAGDQAISLDFTLPDAMRPTRGPGLALLEADRAARLVAAGAYLGLGTLVAASGVEERGASYLAATLYDVGSGEPRRAARVRLANGALPAGGAAALAEYLLGGDAAPGIVEVARPSPLVPTRPGPAEVARAPAAAEPGPSERSAALHYFRPDGKYELWDLHVWNQNGPLPGISWSRPMPPSGRDAFGAYWLLDLQHFPDGRVHYVIHSGDRKEQCARDMSWRLEDSRELWVNAGDCKSYLTRDEALRARK